MPPLNTPIRSPQLYAAVFLGGAVGALLHAGLLELQPTAAGQWPWATFVANLAGCAVLAFLITHQRESREAPVRLALLGTGFCGALTTFSTVQLELYEMIDAGNVGLAAGYAAASIAAGFLVVGSVRRFVSRGRELA